MKTTSIMIVGVGGQGTLLASKLAGKALMSLDYDVKLSEVHGMSQRGGSVVTYVKYGERVYSPIVDIGEADFIIAFEALEAARWLKYLKPNGKLIVNTQELLPMPVISGAMQYPENIIGTLETLADVTAIDALKLAEQAGSAQAVNTVLMGVFSKASGLPESAWHEALNAVVPAKFLDINTRAFALGRAH